MGAEKSENNNSRMNIRISQLSFGRVGFFFYMTFYLCCKVVL